MLNVWGENLFFFFFTMPLNRALLSTSLAIFFHLLWLFYVVYDFFSAAVLCSQASREKKLQLCLALFAPKSFNDLNDDRLLDEF